MPLLLTFAGPARPGGGPGGAGSPSGLILEDSGASASYFLLLEDGTFLLLE